MSGGPGELRYMVTPLAAIGIPLGQGLISGLTVGVICGSTAWYLGNPRALAIMVISGALAFGAAWAAGLAWWRGRIEGAKAKELPAQINQAITRVEVIAQDPSGAYLAGAWADLPISLAKLAKVARRVEAGADFSLADLGGAGKPLSRSEFEELRGEFIRRGLAAWNHVDCHNQGCSLTRAGGAVLRRLAEQGDNPTTPHHARILPSGFTALQGLHTHTNAHRILEG